MSKQILEYDPFKRGAFPVGVISQDIPVPREERIIPTEIWFPATDEYFGKDLSKETEDKYVSMDPPPTFWEGPEYLTQSAVRDAKLREGSFPLIAYSHGNGGHRRLTSHLCCHLASHGYVVISPDHLGNTFMDFMSFGDKTEQELIQIGTQVFINRPKDITFLIDCILNNETLIPSDAIETDSIGITGYSYGGWTILMAALSDQRISAILPIAPGGGKTPDSDEDNPLYNALKLNWDHEIATLYIAAEKDSLVPIASVNDLFNRTPEPKKMIVINNADHFHFCTYTEMAHEMLRSQPELLFGDTPFSKQIKENMLPITELCPSELAQAFLNSLGLAHMDAHLKNNRAAEKWLKGNIKSIMTSKGIDVEVV